MASSSCQGELLEVAVEEIAMTATSGWIVTHLVHESHKSGLDPKPVELADELVAQLIARWNPSRRRLRSTPRCQLRCHPQGQFHRLRCHRPIQPTVRRVDWNLPSLLATDSRLERCRHLRRHRSRPPPPRP
jgi:hypothetical protein